MLIRCRECGREVSDSAGRCPGCGATVLEQCPKCGAYSVRTSRETVKIDGKTKTSYSANLNPLKPFTFVNKKEKVIRPDRYVEQEIKKCESCGWTNQPLITPLGWVFLGLIALAIIVSIF